MCVWVTRSVSVQSAQSRLCTKPARSATDGCIGKGESVVPRGLIGSVELGWLTQCALQPSWMNYGRWQRVNQQALCILTHAEAFSAEGAHSINGLGLLQTSLTVNLRELARHGRAHHCPSIPISSSATTLLAYHACMPQSFTGARRAVVTMGVPGGPERGERGGQGGWRGRPDIEISKS